ncbi:MAG: PhzF family phenazine biosynthesis protein [Gammaproteobacteria bacterium]|nr:PhzF family phenazine biosynthesis protein [Gammaproteobacteria bacterium]
MRFYLVDVFAEKPLAGNQLAVFFCDKALDTATLQAIARETNFSETTFITGGSRSAGYDVRIFTPAHELPFAGHPVLGTAAVLMRHYNLPVSSLTLHLGVGAVTVTTVMEAGDPVYWLQGPPVDIVQTVSNEQVFEITGASPQDIDTGFPVQRLRVGPEFSLVPFRSLRALDAMRLDVNAHRRHFGEAVMSEVYGVSREARDPQHDLSVRLLFDAGGVREDAATGSAAVCLGVWLLDTHYLGTTKFSLRVEQGGLIGRPSTLYLKGSTTEQRNKVSVGGRIAFIASGEWPMNSDAGQHMTDNDAGFS